MIGWPVKTVRVLFALLAGSVCVVCLLQSAAEARGRFAGKRVIFDESTGWTTPEGAARTLARVKAAGFNVYAPNVWHGRGTTWPSQYAPWDPRVNGVSRAGSDPLRHLVAAAHAMGIEVHAWFTVVLRQADLHPELALPSAGGEEEGAFDVHNERFHRWMADLIGEVAGRYDLDGVNLDYVRAVKLCDTEFCKRDYFAKYGRSLSADSLIVNVTPRLAPTLVEYQKTAVTSLVSAISHRIRSLKPGLVISVDAIPDVAGPEQGQDAVEWVNRGLVDTLFRMDYYRTIDVRLTDSIRARLREPDALTLLIANVTDHTELRSGQSHAPRDGRWLAETVSMIQRRWPDTGVGVYLYTMLSDEQVRALRSGPFALPRPEGLSVR
ncbi:MAG: family 10 glycosylhydrolase [Nitrospirota bacterium]